MRPRPRHAWPKARLLVSLLAWLFPLLAFAEEIPLVTAKDLEGPFSIEGQWRFQPGDNIEWAGLDFDDSQWGRLHVPGHWPIDGFPETGQLAWYRLSLQLAPDAMEGSDNYHGVAYGLGVQIGSIQSAYELYANGRLLGGAGRLPPLAKMHYGEHKVHFVPLDAIGPDGRLDLALRVWGGTTATVRYWGGGPYAGPFAVGDYSSLLRDSISGNVASLVLSGLFLVFGLNHLYLYRRNRQLDLYLWFGLTSINIAIYSLMLTQWRFLLPVSFDTLKTVEFGAVYILPAITLQMVWTLLGVTITPWMRAYQLSFIVFTFFGMTNPWDDTRPISLNLFQLWVLPVLLLIPVMLWKSMRAGNTEVRTMFLGLIIFAITCINDILIDLVRLDTPRMIYYGFGAAMLSMAISVDNRFTAMLNKLEREVEQHTEELRRANDELARAARVDTLTGLLNRRGFTEDARKEIQRVGRGGENFALVLADIDYFKSINDMHGHDCGDKILRLVSNLFQQRLRDIDIVGRWGGEEFIFVLPETDVEGAAVVAEFLRSAVETTNFRYEGTSIRLTATFGITQYTRGETLDATVMRADTALYRGKGAGRNQVALDEQQRDLSIVSRAT